MASRLIFQHIGLFGYSVGSVNFTEDGIEWRDRANMVKTFDKENISHGNWTIFGTKGFLKFYLNDGKIVRLDGFAKADRESIVKYTDNIGILVENEDVACDGSNFGDISFDSKKVKMVAPTGKQAFELQVENISNCMIADKNRNEVEIQFHESDTVARDEDALVQIRLHFPSTGADDEDMSLAEDFQGSIEKSITRSVSGHIIVEFDSDDGTFVTPRGRYGIQMYADFLRMHGAKYDYKIQYNDIGKLFLLPKPDGQHQALVICLEKPIRQGNQRYQHLVLQTHMAEHTIAINMSDEELQSQYEGQLTKEMTMPLCNLYAKVFKIISGSKVFVPKNFLSDRSTHCVKCSLKANEGLLYPLEKSFVFIHKPTILISFDDIDSVEFQRYKAAATSATRNFDLMVILKASAVTADGKEFCFSGIDRTEYNTLYQFLNSKKLRIRNIDETTQSNSLLERLGETLGEDEEDEDDEDDSDFEENADSGSGSGSEEDSGSDEEDEENVKEKSKEKQKTEKKIKSSPKVSKQKPRAAEDEEEDEEEREGERERDKKRKKGSREKERETDDKKKSAKKDKNAPKKPRTAYTYFLDDNRANIKTNNPEAAFGDISKLAGEMWKSLSGEEKMKYESQAKEDKDRYEKEMDDYVPPEAEDQEDGGKQKKKKVKKEKDKNAPKGALSAYFIFSGDQRKELKEKHPELTIGEMAKLIGSKWGALSDAEKATYEERSKQDKVRYTEEMQSYSAIKNSQGQDDEDDKMEEEDEEE